MYISNFVCINDQNQLHFQSRRNISIFSVSHSSPFDNCVDKLQRLQCETETRVDKNQTNRIEIELIVFFFVSLSFRSKSTNFDVEQRFFLSFNFLEEKCEKCRQQMANDIDRALTRNDSMNFFVSLPRHLADAGGCRVYVCSRRLMTAVIFHSAVKTSHHLWRQLQANKLNLN